jgi:hypothetical protein
MRCSKRKDGRRGSHGAPLGDGRIGNQFWLVAEHGMKAGYVRNIERDPHIRLKLREGLKYRWHAGTAHLLSDDDPRERQHWGNSTAKQRREFASGASLRDATPYSSN